MYTLKEIAEMCGVASRTLDYHLNYIRITYPDFAKNGVFEINEISLYLRFAYAVKKSNDLSYGLAEFTVAMAQQQLENHSYYKECKRKNENKIHSLLVKK